MNETTNNQEFDNLLTRFFRAEMPEPWPACSVEPARQLALTRSRFRSVGRLALAASILVFFLGYFTLAGRFPRQASKSLDSNPGQEIGKMPRLPRPLDHSK